LLSASLLEIADDLIHALASVTAEDLNEVIRGAGGAIHRCPRLVRNIGQPWTMQRTKVSPRSTHKASAELPTATLALAEQLRYTGTDFGLKPLERCRLLAQALQAGLLPADTLTDDPKAMCSLVAHLKTAALLLECLELAVVKDRPRHFDAILSELGLWAR